MCVSVGGDLEEAEGSRWLRWEKYVCTEGPLCRPDMESETGPLPAVYVLGEYAN